MREDVLFHSIFEQASIGVGREIAVNPAFCRMTGSAPALTASARRERGGSR